MIHYLYVVRNVATYDNIQVHPATFGIFTLSFPLDIQVK